MEQEFSQITTGKTPCENGGKEMQGKGSELPGHRGGKMSPEGSREDGGLQNGPGTPQGKGIPGPRSWRGR